MKHHLIIKPLNSSGFIIKLNLEFSCCFNKTKNLAYLVIPSKANKNEYFKAKSFK